jgi:hypothetical protein
MSKILVLCNGILQSDNFHCNFSNIVIDSENIKLESVEYLKSKAGYCLLTGSPGPARFRVFIALCNNVPPQNQLGISSSEQDFGSSNSNILNRVFSSSPSVSVTYKDSSTNNTKVYDRILVFGWIGNSPATPHMMVWSTNNTAEPLYSKVQTNLTIFKSGSTIKIKSIKDYDSLVLVSTGTKSLALINWVRETVIERWSSATFHISGCMTGNKVLVLENKMISPPIVADLELTVYELKPAVLNHSGDIKLRNNTQNKTYACLKGYHLLDDLTCVAACPNTQQVLEEVCDQP